MCLAMCMLAGPIARVSSCCSAFLLTTFAMTDIHRQRHRHYFLLRLEGNRTITYTVSSSVIQCMFCTRVSRLLTCNSTTNDNLAMFSLYLLYA
uniref:Hypothetical secreted protein n=1 Tax=Glossina morsitans morsitans TaxID=37546 RepID=D3TSH1_GLOMM